MRPHDKFDGSIDYKRCEVYIAEQPQPDENTPADMQEVSWIKFKKTIIKISFKRAAGHVRVT